MGKVIVARMVVAVLLGAIVGRVCGEGVALSPTQTAELQKLTDDLKAKIELDGPFTPEMYRKVVVALRQADPGSGPGADLWSNARNFADGKIKATLFLPFVREIVGGDAPHAPAVSEAEAKVAYELAGKYEAGTGVPQDMASAVALYRKAAKGGNVEAMDRLGFLSSERLIAEGKVADYPEALKWYLMAAENGDLHGMKRVGDFYQFGWSVDKDIGKAGEWYNKAIKGGDGQAMVAVAVLLYEGKEVKKDDAEALKWFYTASMGKDPLAKQQADQYIAQMAQGGYAPAVAEMKRRSPVAPGVTTEPPSDPAPSVVKGSSDPGVAAATDPEPDKTPPYIADLYKGEGFDTPTGDYQKAMEYYKKSVDEGGVAAMFDIGMLYDEGHGVIKDYAMAREWFNKAASLGDARAMGMLGALYFDGLGGNKDVQEGISLMRKAAKLGDRAAKGTLRTLNIPE